MIGDYESTTTRAEHMDWAKKRALEYCDRGDIQQAYGSLASDLRKHKETADHPFILIGMQMLIGGHLKTVEKMREFIEGFG